MNATRRLVFVTLAATAVLACGGVEEKQATSRAPAVTTTSVSKATTTPPPYYCNAVGTGIPPGGHGNGSHVSDIYAGKSKGPLTEANCKAMTRQWKRVVAATKKFDTRAKGEAAGWHAAAEYIVGLGTHHTRGSVIPTETDPSVEFDPSKPNFLIYGGFEGDAPLMGVAYTYLGPGLPPEGYAGGNDWWHEHTTICMAGRDKILAGAETISDEACAKLGGFNFRLTGPGGFFGEKNHFYMLHAWLPPHDYRPDVFVSGNPCLLDKGLAPKSHPCWAQVSRDPSLGPPPGTDGHEHAQDGHDMSHDATVES